MGAAAVAAVASGSTVSAALSSSVDDVASNYDTVVNIVDAGADPTGDTPINSVLNDVLGDNTLVVFPDGQYSIGKFNTGSLSNYGFVAADGASPTIVPNKPVSQFDGYPHIITFQGRDFLVDGFQLDYTRDGYGGRIQCIASGDFTLRNVTVEGENAGGGTFRFDVRNSNGSGLVENVTAVGGGGTFGFFVGLEHEGDILFRDCEVADFANNGLYGSAPARDHGGGGSVRVEDSLFRNNNVANVRLGGPKSYVKRTRVVVDGDIRPIHGKINARGIRFDEDGGALVEDCDIVMDTAQGNGGIVFTGNSAECIVRNTRIAVNSSGHDAAIHGKSTSMSTGSSFENVSITGSASDTPGILLRDRSGAEISDSCIQLKGSNQDGLVFIRSDATVVRTNVNVTGKAIDFNGVDGTVQDVTYSDSCPLPGSNTGSGETADSSELRFSDSRPSAGDPITYSFEVDGDLSGTDINSNDSIDGTTGSGQVNGGSDSYQFTGSLVDVTVDDAVRVEVDGTEIQPDSTTTPEPTSTPTPEPTSTPTPEPTSTPTPEPTSTPTPEPTSTPTPEPDPTRSLRFSDSRPSVGDPITYSFEVDGDLSGTDINPNDSIDGTTGSGQVNGGSDSYQFTGSLVDVTVDDAVRVEVDGTEVDPTQIGSDGQTDSSGGDGSDGQTETLDNLVVFDGSNDDSVSSYRFSVTGSVEPDPTHTTQVDDGWDTLESNISDGAAVGIVHKGADAYRFSGTLVDLEVRGTAIISFER